MLAVIAAVIVSFSSLNYAKKPSAKGGEVTKIEGAMVEVKDAKGKTHMLHTDDTTKKTGEIVVGAKVIFTEAGGHAMTITVDAVTGAAPAKVEAIKGAVQEMQGGMKEMKGMMKD